MKKTNVLWTGGWDSTFRILDLILLKNLDVQPHYLLDPNRLSQKNEIRAMQAVQNDINKITWDHGQLNDIRFIDIRQLDTAYYREIYNAEAKKYVGDQYVFLAAYADQYNVDDLEICIETGGRAQQYLARNIIEINTHVGKTYALNPDCTETGKLLFKKFQFPIINMTKLEMREIAKRNDFFAIMLHTWFCHKPINDEPCGQCGPCIYTIHDGLAARIPWKGKIRYLRHLIHWKLGKVTQRP